MQKEPDAQDQHQRIYVERCKIGRANQWLVREFPSRMETVDQNGNPARTRAAALLGFDRPFPRTESRHPTP